MAEYQVIARKWRPVKFSDVVGQQHVVRTLLNAIESKRTAHAYLFVGPRGVGKTTLARIFAKALNCLDDRSGEPCGECESCRAIMEERSLDIIEVDAASRNSTTDMRELAEDVLTSPSTGRYKIYIIDEVHMLSKAAWNVLLKTVEEPPAHVKFIFATTEVHQVLPTIISRCQRFDLLPIATKLIAERLQLIAKTENVDISPEAVEAIARAAEGGMRDAQSLLDQMIAFFSQSGSGITEQQVLSLFGLTDRRDIEVLLNAMLHNEPGKVVAIIGNLARRGKNLETLFDDLLSALRALQLCLILPDPSELLDESAETIARWKNMAASSDEETVQLLLETISPVGRILHDALNKQVYLETILLKAMREAHAVRISDILKRLNQLRTAGELKFLNDLPPAARENTASPKSDNVDVTELLTKDEPVTTVAEPQREVTTPTAPAVMQEESTAPAAGETEENSVSETKEAPVQEIQRPALPLPADNEERGRKETLEPEVERTFDEPDPEIVLEKEIAPHASAKSAATVSAPAAKPEDSNIETWFDGETEGDFSEAGVPQNIQQNDAFMEEMKQQNSNKALEPESKKPRRSVINDSPEIRHNVKNDPEVKMILDLFNGDVIDVHK